MGPGRDRNSSFSALPYHLLVIIIHAVYEEYAPNRRSLK